MLGKTEVVLCITCFKNLENVNVMYLFAYYIFVSDGLTLFLKDSILTEATRIHPLTGHKQLI